MLGLAKLAGPWLYVAIALACAAAGGWIVGALKDREIVALKLAHAESVTKQLTDIFEARTAFDQKHARADALILTTLKELAAKRADDDKALDETLTQEASKDETLKACLDMQLPATILRQFSP